MGTGLGSAAASGSAAPGGKGGKRREYLVGFAVSSASPALAAVATNPIEVVKVRAQPQTQTQTQTQTQLRAAQALSEQARELWSSP